MCAGRTMSADFPSPSAAVSFALEHVVQVRVLSAQQRDQRRDPVRGEEERSPSFALADVNAFVVTRHRKKLLIAAEDDVAERHRRRPAAEEGAVLEEEGYESAVDLEYALDPLHV